MGHLMIAVALLAFAGLDLVFVRFSDTPAAALTFAVLSFLILLILSGAAGSFMDGSGNRTIPPRPLLGPGLTAVLARLALAAFVPVLLLLLLAYIQELDDPLDPNETVQLGSTITVFWLLMSLALVGAVLGFLWPPHRCLGGCSGWRHRGVGPKPVELVQGRRQPGRITAGPVYLDGVGVYLPHRRLGGTRLAPHRRIVSVSDPAQRFGVTETPVASFWPD